MSAQNPARLTDEEFAGLRLALIDELAQRRRTDAAVTGKRKKAKETKKGKAVREKAGPTAVVDRPAGGVPARDGDGTPLWELPPQELRVRLDAQLWPAEAPGAPGAWVPKPPMTLGDYLADGA